MVHFYIAAAAAALATSPATEAAVPATARQSPAASEAEIDPQRLSLAREAVSALLPEGSYGRMMSEMMGGSMDAAMGGIFDMTPQDLGAPAGEEADDSSQSLREKALEEDPHFEERMRIMTKVMGEEMGRIGAVMEPAMREGLTRAVARRFTSAELIEVNRFFVTDAGRKFGSQMLMLWVDPEVMKAMMEGMPAMMKEMPAMMKKVEAATAHLPKPKKPDRDEEADEQPESAAGQEE